MDYEGKNGDLDSYPDNFADDVYMVAYGVDGLVDTVDSEVYDTSTHTRLMELLKPK